MLNVAILGSDRIRLLQCINTSVVAQWSQGSQSRNQFFEKGLWFHGNIHANNVLFYNQFFVQQATTLAQYHSSNSKLYCQNWNQHFYYKAS
jgi:hypothetical protein